MGAGRKRGGNGMEIEWKRIGNRMETERQWNGMEWDKTGRKLDGIYMEYDGYGLGKERGGNGMETEWQ